MGMSFGALTRHNDANYSAARQDMLEDEREIGPQQDALIDHDIMPIYELWFRFAVIEGRIEGVDLEQFLAEPDRFTDAEYIAPARPWIDPEKEANAYEKALKLRIITRKEIVAMRGGRFQNLLAQIEQERAEAKTLGLAFPEDVDQAALLTKADKGGPVTDPTDADNGGPGGGAAAPTDSNNGDGSGDQQQGLAAAGKKGRRVKLAQADAPNYRAADDPVRSCSTCSNAVGMYCKAYDFNFSSGFTCDAWTAAPPNDGPSSGAKIVPPGPVPGDPAIDSAKSSFNDRAARGLEARAEANEQAHRALVDQVTASTSTIDELRGELRLLKDRLLERPAPQVFNVHPSPAPSVSLENRIVTPEPAAPVIQVNIPEQPTPIVNVAAPHVDVQPPVVNVASPTVNVAAPSVTVNPPAVNVAAPSVTVNPQVTAPNVEVTNVIQPPPPTNKTIKIERDREGKTTGATVEDAS
jgi:uncharacterized coiled-coil protein SlyX